MSKAIRKNIQKHLRAAVLGAFCGLSLGTMLIRPAFALPSGEHDMRNIDAVTRAGQNMDITGTGNAVIKWNDFSLNSGDVVKFSGMARMLNYVDGKYNPSLIDGTINATGINLYIINPSGVLFGDNSIVNAGHLFVSSRSLTNTDIDNFVTGGDPLSGTATLGGGLLSSNIVGAYDIADGDIMMLGKVAANSLTVEGNVIQIKNTKNITNPTKTALLQGDEVKLISDNPVEVGFEVPKWENLDEDQKKSIRNDLSQAKYGNNFDSLDSDSKSDINGIIDYLKTVTLNGEEKEVPLYYYADKYGVWKELGQETSGFDFVMAKSGEKMDYAVQKLDGTPGTLDNYRLITSVADLQAMNKSAYLDLGGTYNSEGYYFQGYPSDDQIDGHAPANISAGNYMLNSNISMSEVAADGFTSVNEDKLKLLFDRYAKTGNPPGTGGIPNFATKLYHLTDKFNGLNYSITDYGLRHPLFKSFNGTMKNLRFSIKKEGAGGSTGNLISQVMPNYKDYDVLYDDAIHSYFKNIKLDSSGDAKAYEGMIHLTGNSQYFVAGVVELDNIENNITIVADEEIGNSWSGSDPVDGDEALGGLVGLHAMSGDGTGNGSSLKIRNSVNRGSVTDNYGYHTGGFVGWVNPYIYDSELPSSSPVSIEKSVNTGDITGKDYDYTSNAGGFVGYSLLPVGIADSYNKGNVTALGNNNAGGLVGIAPEVSINSSINMGDISGGNLVGGIVGGGYGPTGWGYDSYIHSLGNIKNSYNTGKIMSTWRAGGIAGNFGGNIEKTYNTGVVDGGSDDGASAGGIVGNLAAGGSIANSYNKGDDNVTDQNGTGNGIMGAGDPTAVTSSKGFASDQFAAEVYNEWDIDKEGTNPSATWRVYDGEPLLTAFMRTVTVDPTITPVDAESELPSHVTGDGPYTMDVKDISQVDMAAADPYWTDVELTDKGRALANSRTAITTDKAGNSTQLSATGGGSDNVKLSSSQFGYNFQFKQGNSAVVASDYTAAGITDADKVNKVYLLVNGSPAPGTTPPGPTPPGPTPPGPTPTPRPNPPATESASPAVPDIELNLDEVGKQSKEMFKPQDYPFQKGMYYDLDKSSHQLTYGADVSSDSLADNVVSNEYDLAADGNMNDASVNSGKNTVISEAAPSDDGKKSTQSDEEQEEVN